MVRALLLVLACVLALPASAADGAFDRANGNEPDTLDPQKYELVSEGNILRDLFEGLTTQDADNRVVPGQAESWTASPDGLVWTFTLREGLVWSDGTPVTAADFVAGARRVVDPATAAKMPDLAYKIENARRILDGEMAPDQLGISAPDDRTVVVKLSEPSPMIPDIMASPILAPVPRHLIERLGDEWVKPGNMVSNGPFMLSAWEPSTAVRLVKNPRYREAATTGVDLVAFWTSDDQEMALKRFRAGELDFVPLLPPGKVAWAQNEVPDALKLTPVHQVRYLEINHRRENLADVRVRQALSMAIDRETITAKLMQGTGRAATGLVPLSIDGYAGAPYPFAGLDMTARQIEARRLLGEAGYTVDNPLKLELRAMSDSWAKPVAVAIMAMWQQVGVEVDLLTAEAKTHYAAIGQGEFDIALSGWFGSDDPETFMWLFLTGGGLNESGYSNAAFDAASGEAERTMERTARYAHFATAEKLLLDDAATIPVFWTVQASLVSPAITGFAPTPRGHPRSRFAQFGR